MKTLRLHAIRMLLFTSILTLNACSPTSQNKNFEQPLTQPTSPDENFFYSKRMIDLTLQEKATFNESIETMFREISFSSEMDLINCTLNAAYHIGIGNYGTFTTDIEVINECAVTRDHCALLRKEFAGIPRDVQVPKLEIPLDCHVSATDLHTCYRNLLEEINKERKSHYIPCESQTVESIKEAGSIDPDTFTPKKHPRSASSSLNNAPRFTYKWSILQQAEACTKPGEIGALLRREGLYSSHLSKWHAYFNAAGKDLVKTVKGNAIVPSYVLEYLLG